MAKTQLKINKSKLIKNRDIEIKQFLANLQYVHEANIEYNLSVKKIVKKYIEQSINNIKNLQDNSNQKIVLLSQ